MREGYNFSLCILYGAPAQVHMRHFRMGLHRIVPTAHRSHGSSATPFSPSLSVSPLLSHHLQRLIDNLRQVRLSCVVIYCLLAALGSSLINDLCLSVCL